MWSVPFVPMRIFVGLIMTVLSTQTAVAFLHQPTTTTTTTTTPRPARGLPFVMSHTFSPSSTRFSTTTTATTAVTEQDKEQQDEDSSLLLGQVRKSHDHCQEPSDRDLLVRAALGEQTERTPVWLMRQAGRYMAAFREYSDRLPFRERSETPATAIELSLQCHRAYGMDGIIMFSDILTPLPAMGIDFDVVKGTGPVITTSIQTETDVQQLLAPPYDFTQKVGFVREILQQLSKEAADANTSLIGFVGAPFTLASYVIEGKSSKHCLKTAKLMMQDANGTNLCMSQFLDRLATMVGEYGCYQIESGAQVLQVFESWAHHLSPQQFAEYAKPAALKAMQIIRAKHPNVPIIYYANGGSSYLELQRDMVVQQQSGTDGTGATNPNACCTMIGVDWHVDMAQARAILGPSVPISGNVNPAILVHGTKEQIEQAVHECIEKAGGPGNAHVLNLGHGVVQQTPEQSVKYFVDACKNYKRKTDNDSMQSQA